MHCRTLGTTSEETRLAAATRTLVMGVGNPLMGDEGVGPRVVEWLRSRFEFGGDVDVVDAGTMGFTILNLFEAVDRVLVIDAVDGSGHPPGTVLLLSPEDMAPNQVLHSLHDLRLTDVLDAARLVGMDPEVTCIGVQVERIVQWQVELAPVVEASIEPAARAALDILQSWGIQARERPEDERALDTDAHIITALRTKEPMEGVERGGREHDTQTPDDAGSSPGGPVSDAK